MKWSIVILLMLSLAPPSTADEGMWLFNRFPREAVKQKYAMDASPEFLDNLRLATVRIGGATGAIVSPTGLVLTNQHIVSSCLAAISSGTRDYLQNGFYAGAFADEARCPGLDAEVPTAIQDVTSQFPAPQKKAAPAQTVERATTIARLETECAKRTAETCEVVSLFSGSRYELYRYKR